MFPGGTFATHYAHLPRAMFAAYVTWHNELIATSQKASREDGDRVSKIIHADAMRVRAIPQKLWERVVKRDKSRCRYCGMRLGVRSKIRIDHVYPASKGGLPKFSNLAVACYECNRRKSYLHGIHPLSLAEMAFISDDEVAERRQVLYQSWAELWKDARQHNLEGEYFFVSYRRVRHMSANSRKQLVDRQHSSKLELIYDLDAWIAKFLQ